MHGRVLSMHPDVPDEVKYWELALRILQQLAVSEQQLILRLAVFRWFDRDIASYIWENSLQSTGPLVNKAWKTIQNLPFLETYPDRGFAFHELFRNAILNKLWNDSREIYFQTALMADEYFNQRSEKLVFRAERVYHLIIYEPAKGRDLLVRLMQEFQDTGRFGMWHEINQGLMEHLRAGRLDDTCQALVTESVGRLANVSGNRKLAIEYLEKALVIYSTLGDKESEGGILFSLSWNYNHEGCRDKALDALQAAYRLFTESNNLWYAGECLFRMGEMEEFNGNVERSFMYFKQSFDIFNRANALPRQADALLYMGMTGFLSKEDSLELYKKALGLYNEAWVKYKNMSPDDPELLTPLRLSGAKMLKWRLYTIALNKGDCLVKIGLLEPNIQRSRIIFSQAASDYQNALEIATAMFDARWICRSRLRIGDVQMLLGNVESASKFYAQALVDAQRIDHKLYIGWAHLGLGDVDFKLGKEEKARKHYLAALALYRSVKALSNIRDQVVPRLNQLNYKRERGI